MTTATSSTSFVFLLPPLQFRRSHRKCTTLLCNKATSFPLILSSTSSPRRRRLAGCPISSSLTEQIGGVKKKWSDLSSLNYWVVKDYYRLVNSVNALEPHIQKLSEAFAVVREAAKRKLGMRHFDVQIIGGAVLHDGSIAEMKTGEGKTLVSTLAAYLYALSGEGVHGARFRLFKR